ncbi:MAG: hypothetical protein QNK37_17960 [Acidobacteriota bacterium]|nr:hypothetical protein [Acidobacteriota bacterium]
MFGLQSIDHVCEVSLISGCNAPAATPPDVFIELPHGATEMHHLQAAKRLTRQYPGDRHDLFFTANTDQGSPEYALRLAEMLTETDPSMKVLILRCLLPRTIVDVNRIWAKDEEAGAAGLTRGVPDYITHPDDLAKIIAIYERYQDQARKGYDVVCGNGGFAFNLHTYAPISVKPNPDEYIVDTLIKAYQPDMVDTWPKRPVVELITAPPGGASLTDDALCAGIVEAYAAIGIEALENDPFPLHPATMAYEHAVRYPGQTLTLELSRASLAEVFDPFIIMTICPEKVETMTRPPAAAFQAYREKRSGILTP